MVAIFLGLSSQLLHLCFVKLKTHRELNQEYHLHPPVLPFWADLLARLDRLYELAPVRLGTDFLKAQQALGQLGQSFRGRGLECN